MNLVFHISVDGSEIELKQFLKIDYDQGLLTQQHSKSKNLIERILPNISTIFP